MAYATSGLLVLLFACRGPDLGFVFIFQRML
jgi:hypothetical protein